MGRPEELDQPRELGTKKPIRVVFVGGFLGSGKTTVVRSLAASLVAQGVSVGIVTNDQSEELVDTEVCTELKLPVAEVAGGSFSTQFGSLIEAIDKVASAGSDVVLCEPVGCDTDVVATVINPLKAFYGETVSVAPYAVLVDPVTANSVLSMSSTYPGSVDYIIAKQLEEADLIVLNKIDIFGSMDIAPVSESLFERFGRPVLQVSALRGMGMEGFATRLTEEEWATAQALEEFDYDVYALGESVLGWCNTTFSLQSLEAFDANRLLEDVMHGIRIECSINQAEIAHVKGAVLAYEGSASSNLTHERPLPKVDWTMPETVCQGRLVVNARVSANPDLLGRLVTRAMEAACAAQKVLFRRDAFHCFNPESAQPSYRLGSVNQG